MTQRTAIHSVVLLWYQLLSAFVKLQKAIVSFVMSALSFLPYAW